MIIDGFQLLEKVGLSLTKRESRLQLAVTLQVCLGFVRVVPGDERSDFNHMKAKPIEEIFFFIPDSDEYDD